MELRGVGVGRGVATATIVRMPEPIGEPADVLARVPAEEAKAEVSRVVATVSTWLRERGAKAGGVAQGVLEAQALMAQDPSLAKDIAARIDAGKTAERAVFEAFAQFQTLLLGMGGYMAERAADLADVSGRIIAELRGVPAPGVPERDEPFVLVARDLAPADTAMLDFDVVQALITRDGGPTSHTAILARAKSIPAVVGVVGAEQLRDGDLVIVDAAAGQVITQPSERQIAAAGERREAWLHAARGPALPGRLADGTEVPLLANIGGVDDAAAALAAGAEGVGLFRTEFLFLDAQVAPTVEYQTSAYRAVFEAFAGKKVVVRCLDAGADKPLSFLTNQDEENPALGLRGLRALRASEQILRDQLTALVAAEKDAGAEVWVMAPMVADAEETDYFVELARHLGVKVAGVMAEVPSLAVVADQVCQRADFVSIGTNDLTQYTMAADRMLGSVAGYQDPWHPAVLRLIAEIGRAGTASHKPVGVCGEAAADPDLAVILVGLGATSLSMTAAALPDVRAALGEVSLAQARAKATAALAARTAAEARAAAKNA